MAIVTRLNKIVPREETLPEAGLGMALRETYFAFNRVFRAELGKHDVTFGQYRHLKCLFEEDGISQAELSKRIGITKAESTEVIESMDRADLIRRHRDETDRRRLLVFLTPRGRALRPKLDSCAKKVNRLARLDLNREEAILFFDLLDRIRKQLV
jgi:DNA-binding MarR family transcriptional regulator